MTNGNESIFPDDKENPQFNSVHYGLTKREYFASAAMQGILAGYQGKPYFMERIVSDATGIADALISELNKNNQ